MHIGAQPVPPAIVKRWLKIFPKQQYDTDYGLSESIGPGCVHLGVDNLRKLGAIGKAGYGWRTKVVTPDGEKAPRGEIGELCVKGPGVMEKYYKNAKATAETLRDGWLLTGDMVREDEDGFIHIVDRKKDVIITGGENIYPVQVEDFFHKSPLVKDIAVIGVPDARLGEIAIAIVSLSEGATHARRELEKFALGLPRYKRPRKIIFGDVPRNPTGKIEKVKLREKYS
jgi:acyl-CoA synthetase (AMP-forming)/AMP-acid ligase II